MPTHSVKDKGTGAKAQACEQTAKTLAVECKNLWKIYKMGKLTVEALRGVDLQVKKGEILVVMGHSGCGKTTLLNCLSGIDESSDGSVNIDCRDLAKMSDSEKTEYRGKKVGFIFQNYNLIPVLTAVENVELPLLIAEVPAKVARKKAMDTLKLVDLEGSEDHLPMELSGGQQQRVAIARSLANDPTIIFADEPTGNLDTQNSMQVMELLAALNKKLNQTYIIVTHDDRVAKFAHRVIRMDNGKILKVEHKKAGGA
jgi:putative ABC transport system ATP-binding protein